MKFNSSTVEDQNRDLIVQKGGLHLILMELRKNPPVGVFKKVCLTIGNIFNSPMTGKKLLYLHSVRCRKMTQSFDWLKLDDD
jgi:hypothetical protein